MGDEVDDDENESLIVELLGNVQELITVLLPISADFDAPNPSSRTPTRAALPSEWGAVPASDDGRCVVLRELRGAADPRSVHGFGAIGRDASRWMGAATVEDLRET
jgi:hypothetical protein